MKVLSLNLVFFLLSAGGVFAAEGPTIQAGANHVGPSFSCPAPQDPLGQLICNTPALARTDLEFVQAYQALKQQSSADQQKELRSEAAEFGQTVRSNCKIAAATGTDQTAASSGISPSPAECVDSEYKRQRAVWLAKLDGPAAQEAGRSVDQQILLQHDLQLLGLLGASASDNGVFGSDTRTAIANFQQTMGLPKTGLLGDKEANLLSQQALLHAPSSSGSIPTAATRSAWDDFQGKATAVGIKASAATDAGCTVSFDVRDPKALAETAHSYLNVSDITRADGTKTALAVTIRFLQTQFASEAVHALYSSQPSNIDRCKFQASSYTTDIYGRDVSQLLFSFGFDRDTYTKIVWNRFDSVNMPKVMTSLDYSPFVRDQLKGTVEIGPLPDAASKPTEPDVQKASFWGHGN